MFKSLFLDHPRSVDESYIQHFVFALRFSALLFLAGAAALIHALIPGLCKSTASRLIRQLHARIDHRGPVSQPAE